jgi:serine/threonine protein phosphatase PrpC
VRIAAHASATHAGRKRRHNEDAYVEQPPLFAIADGMGGANAGEIASGLAAGALEENGSEASAAEERVVDLIQEANRRVFKRANEDESASGMGTTMTVALVDDGGVTIGHVGDSRAYRLRGGELEQLTDDHSLVAELVRSGRLTPEEADMHPQRSVITRAVGTDPDVDVDAFTVPGEPGDVYLLCSDGLTDMVDDGIIRGVFQEHPGDLKAAAKALVGAANRVGGDDNITVVCFELGGEGGDDTGVTQAMDIPTQENALPDEDTLSGLEGPTAVTAVAEPAEAEPEAAPSDVTAVVPPPAAEPPGPSRGVVAPAVLILAIVAIALLVWLVLR